MITIMNLPDSLNFLIRNDVVFDEIKKDFPEILADLVSYRGNPNCSCRGRVFKFFTEALQKDSTVLNKYIKNQEELAEVIKSGNEQRQSNNYNGKVFIIDKTQTAWSEFSKTLAGKSFRGFSVVERDDVVAVYFL